MRGTLDANNDYWGGKPGLPKAEFNAVRDVATRVANLLAGAVIVGTVFAWPGLWTLVLVLGVAPPTPSWGGIMSTGRNCPTSAWRIATFPGLCLFLLIPSVNMIGDWLRDRFDPRTPKE